MAAAPPKGPIEILERTVNDVLIHAGKLIRAQSKQNQRLTNISATKLAEENNAFNAILDSVESDIIRAKSTLLRDLQQVRARKSAAAEAATTAPQNGQQAPPAAMDDQPEDPAAAGNGNAPSQASGNMDLDPPATTSTPAAATPNAHPAPTPSQMTQPSPAAISRDTFSQSPQWITKPAPAPSPAMKAGSPAAATAKAASPILIKSATASPAAEGTVLSRPQTPSMAATAAGSNASRAIPLSASTSPSVKNGSPVLTKKNASPAAMMLPITTAPTSTTADPVSTTTAPPTTVSEAPVAPADVSADTAMDDLFGLNSPSSSGAPGHADLGFTDKQFLLVPDEQTQPKQDEQQDQQWQQQPQQQQDQPQQQQQLSALPPQPEAQMQPPPAPLQQLAEAEAEFDVEEFAVDAAQNLMTDSAFSTAPAAPTAAANMDGQAQLQLQQQAGSGLDDNGLNSLVDNEDDLFKYIDDNMDALGDTSTSFDELYGTADTVDLDDFFDT